MARSPDYLRDRGLADSHEPPPQVVPFVIGADGLPAQPAAGVAVLLSPGMPDDYTARLAALDWVARIVGSGERVTQQAQHDALDLARRAHAFLTATEPVPTKQDTFTDV